MPDLKILVVDDDFDVVNIITSSLKAEGRTFITAFDGVEAVEKVMSESPDIVLLDIMMPKMNGYQVCRLMKNDHSTWDIPVLMLTAKDRDTDRMYGMSVGADGYIVKPFHPGDLRAAVDRLLAGSARRPGQCPVQPLAMTSEAGLLSRVNSLLDRKLQEMTFLQEMTKTMVSTFDEDKILGLVLDGIGTYLGYERAVVFMVEEGGIMSGRMDKGFPKHDRRFSFELNDTELLHSLVHNKKPVVLDGDWDGGKFVGGGRPDDGGHRHALVPILSREQLMGVLLIDRGGGGAPFSMERTGVLSTMAGQLGLALENALLYRTTLMMSITDGLTGLYNARYFYDRLELEMSRARRYERPLSLFMLDIDNFKLFNDRYGHLTGDEALKRLAGILKANTRDTDTSARYGGEEFCMILPETDREHAATLAERIRRTVEQADLDSLSGKVPEPLTVSIGHASLEHDSDTPEDFVRRADRALYHAKQTGRNRVCYYTAELC